MNELIAMNGSERLYVYAQSQKISMQTGLIGHLRADFGTDGTGFYSTWEDRRPDLKTEEFKKELDSVINRQRFDADGEKALAGRRAMRDFCMGHREALMDERGCEYGFRTDTGKYAYLMRMNPNRGEYNLYCYCYVKEWLNRHLKASEKGIRFIDSHYNGLYRLPDGGRISITYADGSREEKTCRYIDEYHVEVGCGSTNLYHICEFAERMESIGARTEAVTDGRMN